jgi:hypothetical protein
MKGRRHIRALSVTIGNDADPKVDVTRFVGPEVTLARRPSTEKKIP